MYLTIDRSSSREPMRPEKRRSVTGHNPACRDPLSAEGGRLSARAPCSGREGGAVGVLPVAARGSPSRKPACPGRA